MFLAIQIVGFGSALYLLAVFIGAGQKERCISGGAVKTRQHISQDRGIRMSDMGLVINVINRCSGIKFFFHIAIILLLNKLKHNLIHFPIIAISIWHDILPKNVIFNFWSVLVLYKL